MSLMKNTRCHCCLSLTVPLTNPGNHDGSLDPEYWAAEYGAYGAGNTPKVTRQMWEDARAANIHYLDEGFHTFTVPRTGARLSVYASPYTPEFCGMAFSYRRDQDRFNLQKDCLPGVASIAEHPIPDFPDVDIIMTHGPPHMVRDLAVGGARAGCRNLLRAAARVRPRMYCFGHIHEGWGVEKVTWPADRNASEERVIDAVADAEQFEFWETTAFKKRCVEVDVSQDRPGDHANRHDSRSTPNALDFGTQTLMVNAAIMTVRYQPKNVPVLVHLDLPVPDPTSDDDVTMS